METEQLFYIIKSLLEYVKPSDKEEAICMVLEYIVNECDVDLNELKTYADDEDESLISKCITKIVKECGLDEDEYEDEEW